MDYEQTQHDIKQSPELALRQEEAMHNMAPQRDEGSLKAAHKEAIDKSYLPGGEEHRGS